MTKHKSAKGGIHAIVTMHDLRTTVKLVPKNKIDKGKQLRNVCVHHVGGATRGVTLTAARKQRILNDHRSHRPDANGKCTLHVKNWKAKCACGAM